MCIIVGKYFPGIGWAGAKNRDRKYIPTLDFIESEERGVGRMMMHDLVTGYKEGINSSGVSILNTSLDVLDDESDVESGKVKSSPDGATIATALLHTSALAAAKHVIAKKLVGCTMVFDQENMFLIEASDQDGTEPYRYEIKRIPKTQTVCRTNHGIWLPWASFQRQPNDPQQTQDRISSEARLLQAQQVVQRARKPRDLVDGLCAVNTTHPQLNIMRMSTGEDEFRTTSQQLCVPRERTLYCRPISSHLKFDFWSLNKPKPNVWVEILSNRMLWQRTKKDIPFRHQHMRDVE